MNDESRRVTIQVSSDFDARLADIERYWDRVDQPRSFLRLVEAIEKKVMPLLRRFPAIGRRVFNSKPDAVDTLLVMEELAELMQARGWGPGDLHEYLFDDYVLLYLLSNDVVTFLSLRHTKEVSFDFSDLWGGEP